MKLQTLVERPARCPSIGYAHRLMLLGSCFAAHIGARLQDARFRCDVNPYGVLYNPLSISVALREMLAGKVYAEGDLYPHQGLWHSPMHHGDFSAATLGEALQRINDRLACASAALPALDFLLLTWGTAWVYEDRGTGRVAGNCHKRPEACFRRRRLTVDEVAEDMVSLLSALWQHNDALQVVLTVSPIRHVRDGLHDNQLSKSTLLLAAEQVCAAFPGRVFYFPAYELLRPRLLLSRLRAVAGRAARLPLLCRRPGASLSAGRALRLGALRRVVPLARSPAADGGSRGRPQGPGASSPSPRIGRV